MPLLGGIRPPIAVLCVLILALAGLTAQVLGPGSDPVVPKAVLSSQQHYAEDGAIALRASIDERVTDLRRTAAALNAGKSAEPEDILSDLGRTYQKWTGTTVVDLESGDVLAARGERIPLAWLDKETLTGKSALLPRMVRLETGDVRLMTMVVLDRKDGPQQLLIASNSLSVPPITLGPFRTMAVAAKDGEVLATAGFEQSEALNSDKQREELDFLQKQMSDLSAQAADRTEEHPVTAKEPGSRGYPGVSGTLTGDDYNGRIATAGYASLASSDPEEKDSVAAGLGLTVVAMLPVVAEQSGSTGRELYGLIAAGALVVLGLLAAGFLWARVQRPLLRLFLESRRLARGDLTRPVGTFRGGEAARIGNALERLRGQLGGSDGPGTPGGTDDGGGARRAGRTRFGIRVQLVLTAVLLLLWCVPVGLLLNRTDDSVSVPATMVNDQRDRTDLVSDRVRRALNEAQADLVSTSRLVDVSDRDATESVLEDALRKHTRYAALYVVDADGEVVARTGGDPHDWSDGKDLPLVRVSGEGGKRPVIQAGAPVPEEKGATLVGEVRIEFLNSLLKRPGLGEVRVADAKGRTLAASNGFLAFEELPREALTDLVRAAGVQVGAGPVENGLLLRDGGNVTVAAAAPFSGGGVAADAGWTVVSWQNADRFQITAYEREDRSVLAGLLGLAAIVVCLGWVHLVVARPLRALAASAEKLADGDLKAVLYPTYHDEVGAVVRSLELIRQQLQARRQQQPRRTAEPRTAEPRPTEPRPGEPRLGAGGR
ncbi:MULTISPECIES: HAMP domain-containing protein [Streptomyces]|uniref:HAMP domain-containing protein n=1 Tax=Streptomyces prasinus TaxID=67345 RepID=A0ABX6AYL0_9ACTN|nr:HAMP domain-containing protein [Streptomyces prasinus]QEV07867.1 HAMP domain-containing protein [Streptomyces prasinus]